jgi:hypothetical protein
VPYLQFSRDRRGYENTYVMHAYRRRGGSRARILYWFRSPPNVKVGRSALDEDAIRAIEQGNPDLAFDWERMLKEQPPAEPATPAPPARKGRARTQPATGERRGGPRASEAAAPRAQSARQSGEPVRPASEPLRSAGEPFRSTGEPLRSAGEPLRSTGEPPDQASEPGDLAEPALEKELIESPAASASESVLGSAGLARLQARYAELLTRITDRVADQGRRDALRLEAEALNPDAWVTETEVRDGLASFEATYAAIRGQLGGKKRSRRGGRRRHRRQSPAEGAAENAEPGNADSDQTDQG